jgi:hypothetical protein
MEFCYKTVKFCKIRLLAALGCVQKQRHTQIMICTLALKKLACILGRQNMRRQIMLHYGGKNLPPCASQLFLHQHVKICTWGANQYYFECRIFLLSVAMTEHGVVWRQGSETTTMWESSVTTREWGDLMTEQWKERCSFYEREWIGRDGA